MWNVRATKGDHKWDVTFCRIHHAPDTRSGPDGRQNLGFHNVCSIAHIVCDSKLLVNVVLHSCYIHSFSVFHYPLNIMGTANFRVPQFCAMPSQLSGITQNWGHRNLFPVFADSALQNADGKTSQPVLIWTPASSSAIADKPRDAFVQYPVAQLT